jgi:precorrin-2 dehydrogenase/sirohydrochlorin ferrochelatase
MYPLNLKIAGRRCVVIGGGNVADRKVGSLLECGAVVKLVSPEVCEDLDARAARNEIEWVRRPFQAGDLEGAVLAIAATDDRPVNEAVAAEGRALGVLVNVVDVPDLCDFYVPASISRGQLEITVSTGGASPMLAKRLRMQIEQQFGPEYEPFLALLARLRTELKARVPDRAQRNLAEEAFLNSAALSLLAEGKPEEAESIWRECVNKFAED